MNFETGPPPEHETTVNEAVTEYEAAVDRGEAPDRDAWIARYPALAAYFEDQSVARPLDSTEVASSDDPERTHAYMPDASSAIPRGDGEPERMGDYLLGAKLGGGGQGLVFRARHCLGDLTVALKMVAARDDAESLQDEIRAIASLRHEHIVRILTFGRDQGLWYYTMEEMEGGSLQDRLAELQSDPRKAVALLQQVASGVHHAHTRGILHLDLKPANVLLDCEGRPLVSDFGLAKRLYALDPVEDVTKGVVVPGEAGLGDVQDRLALTNSQVRGTGPYMSPEMASGAPVITTAADIYGLGAIFYTMLTGQPPFRGQTLDETIRRVLWDQPVPPRARNRKVDHELQAVCLKCLHKDPLKRYGSADALASDLKRWLNREPTLAAKPTVGRQIRFWFRRHPFRVAASCVAAVVLWVAVAAGMFGEVQAENRREAGRIAREVELQLRMIGRAVDIQSRQPDLRDRLKAFPNRSPEQRLILDEYLTRAQQDYNEWFGIAGGNPLINVVILNRSGILLADTLAGSDAVGLDFTRRDYFRLLMDPAHPRPRDAVVVSRAFHSVKDFRYKISVSTRIWDGDDCLGVLVANIPIGRTLVVLDMADEPEGATVVSPIDWSYADRGVPPPPGPPPFLAVLDRSYTGTPAEPVWPDPARFRKLAAFVRDSHLVSAVDRFGEGAVSSYHRVGETPLVVVLRHSYPWPIRPVLDPRLRGLFPTILAFFVLVTAFVFGRRAARRFGPTSSALRISPSLFAHPRAWAGEPGRKRNLNGFVLAREEGNWVNSNIPPTGSQPPPDEIDFRSEELPMLTTVFAALILATGPPSTKVSTSGSDFSTPAASSSSATSEPATEDHPSAERLAELKSTIEHRNHHRAMMHAAGAKNRAETLQLMTQFNKMLQLEAKIESIQLSAEQRAMRNSQRRSSTHYRR